MAECDRDGALQMRVGGHRRLRFRLGACEHDLRELYDGGDRLVAGVLNVEAVRGDDLVVARTAGVDLAAERAEQPLDCAVHVLVCRLEIVRADRREPLLDLGQLGLVEEPGGVQPMRVQTCALEVVRQEVGVGRLQVLPDLRRERRLDATRPQRHSSTPSRSSIRRASITSLIFTFSWPIRSEALNIVALRSIDSRSGEYEKPSPRVSTIV